jgi:hypothetical protein
MCFRRGGRRRKSIWDRWAERVLFFWTARELIWTARELLKLAILTAVVGYVLWMLAEGKPPSGEGALLQLIHDF